MLHLFFSRPAFSAVFFLRISSAIETSKRTNVHWGLAHFSIRRESSYLHDHSSSRQLSNRQTFLFGMLNDIILRDDCGLRQREWMNHTNWQVMPRRFQLSIIYRSELWGRILERVYLQYRMSTLKISLIRMFQESPSILARLFAIIKGFFQARFITMYPNFATLISLRIWCLYVFQIVLPFTKWRLVEVVRDSTYV